MNYEEDIARLEATGNFRVLRRVLPRARFQLPDGTPVKAAVILDLETTGLDPSSDEIIEIGMVKFHYSVDGRVFDVVDKFSGLRQPSIPIPPKISQLTGITADDVAGKRFDMDSLQGFVSDAAIIIAHNASFDRPFCERLSEAFIFKPWACSMSEINWTEEGFENARLSSILLHYGLFHEGHRAIEDCLALLEVLAKPLPKSRQLALDVLLNEARRPTVRIWAESAPYDSRNLLKAKGYRWSDGTNDNRRCWWIDIPETEVAAELEFLKTTIYKGENSIEKRTLTAFDRHSNRASSNNIPGEQC
ncbi:DNA polymerase-3 subunit epsilon [Bradyrhizobium sp. USDA 3240]